MSLSNGLGVSIGITSNGLYDMNKTVSRGLDKTVGF